MYTTLTTVCVHFFWNGYTRYMHACVYMYVHALSFPLCVSHSTASIFICKHMHACTCTCTCMCTCVWVCVMSCTRCTKLDDVAFSTFVMNIIKGDG